MDLFTVYLCALCGGLGFIIGCILTGDGEMRRDRAVYVRWPEELPLKEGRR